MGSIRPEQPLLFFLDGLDMRWRSVATVAEQVEGGRRALGALDLPAGAVVAFTWRAGPDAVAADLAIRAGGWTASPRTFESAERSTGQSADESAEGPADDHPEPPPAAARLLLPGEPAPSGGPGQVDRLARLPRAETELSARRDRGIVEIPLPEPRHLPGGALVRPATGTGEPAWRTLATAEIAARVDRLDDALASRQEGPGIRSDGGRGGRRRPVVVACLDPSTPGGRVALDWALGADAALYLEPDAWALGGIAAWCRPTVVAGDGRGMASVAAEIRRRGAPTSRVSAWLRRLARRIGGPRRPGPPFGRLRAALLLPDAVSGSPAARLSADDLTLFAHHGVALVASEG